VKISEMLKLPTVDYYAILDAKAEQALKQIAKEKSDPRKKTGA
jgi:hypothetical protein